ncbi:J domain-containing protein [Emcibacter nanhaiensis]|uniref:J domain-containing protein n=1 Tax=Emcibacter nanhaiensis TaxID=1505037 RepID=A0A501PP94_9PROT|nr:J domain-containing protein [Emcibacter nanhaiensis]TPD61804.1 J domain-containing protein [Emcibacter nanhaiensis]
MTDNTARPHPGLDLGQKKDSRCCDHPECSAEGQHRAPKSRDRLNDYYWFCKDHVRDYNKNWDFFADMDQDQIHAWQRSSQTWHRPTWRMGARAMGAMGMDGLRDDLGIFEDLAGFAGRFTEKSAPDPGKSTYRAEDMRQLAVLGLDESASITDIKNAYKKLVKRYHPDVNSNDESAEEKFKEIVNAYHHMTSLKSGSSE